MRRMLVVCCQSTEDLSSLVCLVMCIALYILHIKLQHFVWFARMLYGIGIVLKFCSHFQVIHHGEDTTFYCFTTLKAKTKGKLAANDKDKIEKAIQEVLDWLDKNQLGEKDGIETKQKELEGIITPIMMKVYQAAGGGEGGIPDMSGGGMPTGGGGGGGPTVEEVD